MCEDKFASKGIGNFSYALIAAVVSDGMPLARPPAAGRVNAGSLPTAAAPHRQHHRSGSPVVSSNRHVLSCIRDETLAKRQITAAHS